VSPIELISAKNVLNSTLLFLIEFHNHVLVQAVGGRKYTLAMINLEIINCHNTNDTALFVIFKLFLAVLPQCRMSCIFS
jgi:hypothetical protein